MSEAQDERDRIARVLAMTDDGEPQISGIWVGIFWALVITASAALVVGLVWCLV
jgi:hypothetical protein